jgi:hypothetical protein
MHHTTISGHHGTHHTAFWIVVGTVVVIAFADVLSLLAIAVAITTTLWWIYREGERRAARDDAEMAPVTHLRPAPTGQHGPKKALPSSRGPRAA